MQVELTLKPKPLEENKAPNLQNQEISYTQFRYLKIKEVQEAKLKVQLEEERKKFLKEKQLEKEAPHKRREGESIQQYMDRMVNQMKKENKFNRKKYKKGEEQNPKKTKKPNPDVVDEEKMIEDIMKMCNGE